jgi:hypothetical protein
VSPRRRRPGHRLLEEWERDRPLPLRDSGRMPDPIPNLLATSEGCAEMAYMVVDQYEALPPVGRRQILLDILENAIDYGFCPPRDLLHLLKRELATKPTGVTAKPEYQKALAVARANPGISVRALAAEVNVPWPTVARWQRQAYWKLAVSMK